MGSPISYSNLNRFETCPRQYYHLSVVRDISGPESEAIKWGNTVHKAIEDRLTLGTPLPEGMQQWDGIVNKVAALPGERHVERKLALGRDKAKAQWKSSWVRGKSDAIVVDGDTAAIFDWKTGKRKLTDQNKFYALLAFGEFPHVNRIRAAFVWLPDKKVDWDETYEREKLPELWGSFAPRLERLEEAYAVDKWPAKPSGLCKAWCPVVSCPHNGRR